MVIDSFINSETGNPIAIDYNMMVLFYAHDAGGANAIAPLIPHFEEREVFAGGPAFNILPGAIKLPENALNGIKPDFILTRTGTLPFIQTYRQFEKQLRALIDDENYNIDIKIPHEGIVERITKFIRLHTHLQV